MDVINSNKTDIVHRKKHKRPNINTKIKHFSIEIYFMWFSALIFLAETLVGKFKKKRRKYSDHYFALYFKWNSNVIT